MSFCYGMRSILVGLQADLSRFGDEATLDDNVESFLSHEEGDPRDVVGRGMEVSTGTCFSPHYAVHQGAFSE